MNDLIGLTMGSAPATTPAKPTDSLIDFDFDDMDASYTSSYTPVPAATSGVAVGVKVVDTKDAAHAWKTCLKESHDMNKYPVVPIVEGPFKKHGFDEFEEMWKAKQNGNHNISMYFLFIPLPLSSYSYPCNFLSFAFPFEELDLSSLSSSPNGQSE